MKYLNNTLIVDVLNKQILILIVLLFSTISLCQTFKIDYSLDLKSKIISHDSTKIKEKKGFYDKINFKILNTIHYTLVHSNSKSVFSSYDNSNIFTISPDETEDLNFLKDFKISNYTSVVYKDFKKKESLQREFILDKLFKISDTIYNYNWNINDSIKFINGIKCYSASCTDMFNNNIIAWYTFDIPISNGPGNYHGLPGLIVEIDCEMFNFSLKSFKVFKSNTDLVFSEKGQIINQKDFVSLFFNKINKLNFKN